MHTRVISNYIFLQEKRPFLARLFLLGINVLFPIQASITDLQVECSEAQLEIITGNLQRKWNDTAKLLGLDKNVISKIEEGGKNPFAEIISNWKKKRNDSSFTYDTLITEFCKSSEFTGKKEYVEQTILSLIPCKLYSIVDLVIQVYVCLHCIFPTLTSVSAGVMHSQLQAIVIPVHVRKIKQKRLIILTNLLNLSTFI